MAFTDGVNVILTGIVTQLSSGAAVGNRPQTRRTNQSKFEKKFCNRSQKNISEPGAILNWTVKTLLSSLDCIFSQCLAGCRCGDGSWDRSLKVKQITGTAAKGIS
jgi:hypothetical protein